jgi:hypothetical protein
MSDDTHLERAYLWLFSVGLDPTQRDTEGTAACLSLAQLLKDAFDKGVAAGVSRTLQPSLPPQISGEYMRSVGEPDDEADTGRFEQAELDKLLRKVEGGR